jgi:NADH:ubiquinone oxidoreductase subunit 5 (subunit L)/multisubunit Na+/H+ antiporter MnhA subunit
MHYLLPKKYTSQIAIFWSLLLFGLIFIQNILFLGQKPLQISWNWINIADIKIPISLYVDDFSRIFGLLAVFVYTLVVFFSVFYLKNEPHLRRYFVYLEVFILMMLGVIWANSLILLYICWEG